MSPSQETTLQFIEEYRKYEVLWNSSLKSYSNKIKKNDALVLLSEKFSISVQEVKKNIKNLRCYFSKEYEKCNRKKSGSGTEEIYSSPWFAYKAMLFLAPGSGNLPRTGRSTDDGTGTKPSTDTNRENIEIMNVLENNAAAAEGANKSTDSEPIELDDINSNDIEFSRPAANSRKRKEKIENDRSEEAYKFLKYAEERLKQRDEFSVFAEHIAIRLRKLDDQRLQSIGQHRIQNILFELETEKYTSISTPSPCSTVTSNPNVSAPITETQNTNEFNILYSFDSYNSN